LVSVVERSSNREQAVAGGGPVADGRSAALRGYPPVRRGYGRAIWGSAAAVLAVLLILLQGVPQTAALPDGGRVLPAVSVPAPDPTHAVTPVAPRALARSTCLLEQLADCDEEGTPTGAPGIPSASGASGWTNITPQPLPASYPTPRYDPMMAFDPLLDGVLLFGGEATVPAGTTLDDTWLYQAGNWTELAGGSSCSATTCPPARGLGMMAFDPTDNQMVLFGGVPVYGETSVVLGDTWAFYGGAWHNLTGTTGTAPSARFDAAFVEDTADDYDLLYGGQNASGATLGDTWTFAFDTWTNITAALPRSPDPRAGASIGASPDGHILLLGGEDNGTLVENDCYGGGPYMGWWFYHGGWQPMNYTATCLPVHRDGGLGGSLPIRAPTYGSPCPRVNAALGWSPGNRLFVLFGGYGETGSACSTFPLFDLNDTWYDPTAPGGNYTWVEAGNASAPSARSGAGYATDYAIGYFVVFGGYAQSPTNDLWRFYLPLTALFTGPSTIQIGGVAGFDQFQLQAYGGSGDLSYQFSTVSVRPGDTRQLAGSGCDPFWGNSSYPVPSGGLATFNCQPLPTSYNVYRITATVRDLTNTNVTYSNWTVTVAPQEKLRVWSEYGPYFYTGYTMSNTFIVYAEVDNQAPNSLYGVIDNLTVPFSATSNNSDGLWFNSSSVGMGGITPGSSLVVFATWSDWSDNATLPIKEIITPHWLQAAVELGELYTNGLLFKPGGKGPFNLTYSISETFPLAFGKLFNCSIPIPLLSGNYSLIPSVTFTYGETSTGHITVGGAFQFAPPTINLGVAALALSASLSLQGTFSVSANPDGDLNPQWVSAVLGLTLTAKVNFSIPIYGIDILGATIGFVMNIAIAPSIALKLLLLPSAYPGQDFISGIGLALSQLLGTFTLPLTVAVAFGLAIASVSIGGTASIALNFIFAPPPFSLSEGWANLSAFVSAQFLFWSCMWTFWSGSFAFGPDAPPQRPFGALNGPLVPPYDNGTGATWTLASRYYNGSGYDANVWDPSGSSGIAVSDLYPQAAVVAAPSQEGSYLLFTNDRVAEPQEQGLTVSGYRLDSTNNSFTALPSPTDPGFVIARPQVAHLPDGDLYGLWDALPAAEIGEAGPLGLTNVELQGAVFYPANETWGPIRTWTTSGFADSYQVDASDGAGEVLALVSNTPVPSASSAERLLVFDLATGGVETNASVSGLNSIVSYRSATGWAVVELLDGNVSVINAATGAVVALPVSVPGSPPLTAASFLAGSSNLIWLLYRTRQAETAYVVNLSSQKVEATLPLGPATEELAGLASGATVYLAASTPSGIQTWSESGGQWANLTAFSVLDASDLGLVQSGSGLLVYALLGSGPTNTPTENLFLGELGVAIAPVTGPTPPATPSPSSGSPASPDYGLYLVLAAAAAAVVLAVVAIAVRRTPPRGAATDGHTTPPPPNPSPAPTDEKSP
jgi:hypothetical protein